MRLTPKTKKFTIKYFLFLGVLFGIFYLPTSEISTLINQAQTNTTLTILNLFLNENQLKGIDIWINPHYKIIITQACNGMIPILFLSASILAYPSRIVNKTVWLILGYIALTIVNIIRLLIVTKVTMVYGSSSFYWIHDIFGNFLLMIFGLGLFVMFIKTSQTTT
jgi:exosortase/archaeosortase family protein